MKTLACYALHYGKEYLAWSIRSVQDVVDEIHVFYTPKPSFGFSQGATCPDTEDELHAEAERFAKVPIHWHRVSAGGEGEHRTNFHYKCVDRNADLMLVVDADEIWDTQALDHTLKHVYNAASAARWLANFANFWQSWDYVVLDQFKPVRVHDMRQIVGPGTHIGVADAYLSDTDQPEPVFHFGYAQREALMRYKWTCHGHQHELRGNWMEEKFMAWTLDNQIPDLHPVVINLWDKAHQTEQKVIEKVNTILHDHPYKGLVHIR